MGSHKQHKSIPEGGPSVRRGGGKRGMVRFDEQKPCH